MVKKVSQTDRRTDGQTDGLNQSLSCLVAAKKTNKVDGLFVILFGPLILKIVSPLDPHSLIARRNPANIFYMIIIYYIND